MSYDTKIGLTSLGVALCFLVLIGLVAGMPTWFCIPGLLIVALLYAVPFFFRSRL